MACLVLAACVPAARAHVVQEFYANASSDGKTLRLDVILDATFGLPDGNDPLKPQPPREWLFTLSDAEHETLRANSRALLQSILSWSTEGSGADRREIPFTVTFPDYAFEPPNFPKQMSLGAFITVRLEVSLPEKGLIQIEQRNREYPYVVIRTIGADDPAIDYLVVYPEEGPVVLPFVKRQEARPPSAPTKPVLLNTMTFFLREGYRHVIPYGWDHILFISSLCLLSFRWRALLEQSLLFTLAHSLTLALVILDWFRLPPGMVEIIIALSIAWMAIENLLVNQVKPTRMALIFGFGLIHGMGFAYVLGNRIRESGRFYQALFFTNLGVELAQITVIALVLLMFRYGIPAAKAPVVQKWASGCIAVGAGVLLITRLWSSFRTA